MNTPASAIPEPVDLAKAAHEADAVAQRLLIAAELTIDELTLTGHRDFADKLRKRLSLALNPRGKR